MTKEETIQSYMMKLDISREEAEQLWKDDHNEVVTPEMAEMERKAKSIKRYEKSDAPRKKAVRERKVDPVKIEIIDTIAKNLTRVIIIGEKEDYGPEDIHILKPEKEITFSLLGEQYSVTLTKHRPPKK